VVLAAFGLWLATGIAVGVYFAATGGHGGKPSVILVTVAAMLTVLALDAIVIRRLWPSRKASR
jgi:hypothetical protein